VERDNARILSPPKVPENTMYARRKKKVKGSCDIGRRMQEYSATRGAGKQKVRKDKRILKSRFAMGIGQTVCVDKRRWRALRNWGRR
jgi:hypothetical protein